MSYTFGQPINWDRVGRIYYINHPRDHEIHNRVVVIFRTNHDSWSCYGFCKHPDKDDCENQDFRIENAQIVAQRPARRQNVDSVPRIELSIRDADNNNKQTLEISGSNAVRCSISSTPFKWRRWARVEEDSLEELLHQGRDVFNKSLVIWTKGETRSSATYGNDANSDDRMLRGTPDS